MAAHRAPRPTLARTMARGVRHAVPAVGRSVAILSCMAWRGARRALRIGGHVAWVALRTLATLTLAVAWVSLALSLLTMSACMGRKGAPIRDVIVADMLRPLGEGAREALAERRAVPAEPRRPRLSVVPSTLARDTDPMPGDDDAWPATGPLWSDADMADAAAEPLTIRATRRLQRA